METIKSHVPILQASPYTKRWWSKELAQMRTWVRTLALGRLMRTRVRTLAKKAYKLRERILDHPVHEQYRLVRNKYGDKIDTAKKDHWEEWVVNTEAMTMWIVNKFTTTDPTDGGHMGILTLKVKRPDRLATEISDNIGKSKALYDVFFAPPPKEDYVPAFAYPKPMENFSDITDEQIHRIISKTKPYCAPEPNGVSNSVFTHCADILVPWLGKLFRATFRLEHYPERWKVYNTVVLRKLGKPDYMIPKAYRPITLLDTMVQLLLACVVEDVNYMAEKHQMLPSRHFGGRPGRTTTDSLHFLVKWV